MQEILKSRKSYLPWLCSYEANGRLHYIKKNFSVWNFWLWSPYPYTNLVIMLLCSYFRMFDLDNQYQGRISYEYKMIWSWYWALTWMYFVSWTHTHNKIWCCSCTQKQSVNGIPTTVLKKTEPHWLFLIDKTIFWEDNLCLTAKRSVHRQKSNDIRMKEFLGVILKIKIVLLS